MKKTKSGKVNIFIYLFFCFLIKIIAIFKGQKIKNKLKIKGPAITLSNHSSWFDFAYTINALYPRRTRFVAAERMFLDKGIGFFLRISHAIPKKLYHSDLKAMINILRALRKKEIVSIFPEGQISITGHSLEIGETISRLIKKANVNVYVIKHQGASLVNPPWSKHSFPGRIDTNMDLIFKNGELDKYTLEEISEKINQALYFDPYEYNKEKQHKYKVTNIENIETVIYKCPTCGSPNIKNQKTSLLCLDCKSDNKYDNYGYLGGKSIVELYLKERSAIENAYKVNPNYQLSSKVDLEGYQNNKVEILGSGIFTLSKEGYHFIGTSKEAEKEINFPVISVSSLPSNLGKDVQIYDDNEIYQFVFSDKTLPIQYVLFGEVLYLDLIKKNLHGIFKMLK